MVISYEGTSSAVTAVSDIALAGLVPTLPDGGPTRNGLRRRTARPLLDGTPVVAAITAGSR